MRIIEGKEFQLFWDMDREPLRDLSYAGRVEWLRLRIEFTLLEPIDAMVGLEDKVYPWLAITELICAGLESLGGFYSNGNHGVEIYGDTTNFCRFVHAFMHSGFGWTADNPQGEPWTYCRHLQEYFRNGLDHGFSILWGGLWHKDQPKIPPGYLRENPDGGVAICPRSLLEDFRRAFDAYFAKLRADGENSLVGENFQARFNILRQQRGRSR